MGTCGASLFDLPFPGWDYFQSAGGSLGLLKARALPFVGRVPSLGCSRVVNPAVRASEPSLSAFRTILSVAAGCLLMCSLGCNTYNPYLGASPTVSSSITSITPSGATAGSPDILLQVNGSGFVAGSTVTWNNSSSTSMNLESNFVSSSEMQARIRSTLLTNSGMFFVGVIAPGPTSGNNAGNNFSNFVPFTVFAGSSSSAVTAINRRALTPSATASQRPSTQIQTATRYQPIIADAADSAFETAT